MRIVNSTYLLVLVFVLGACSNYSKKLTLTTYIPGSDSYNAAVALKEVLLDEGWDFTIITQPHEDGVEAVRTGKVDLAITSNDISINSKGLRSIIPIYNEVLITLVKENSPLVQANNLREILALAKSHKLKIMFSEKGSYSHVFAKRLLTNLGFSKDLYNSIYLPQGKEYVLNKVELAEAEKPDLIFIVGNVDNELFGKLMDLGYIFRIKENLAGNIDESFYSSNALKLARSFPVLIPEYTISNKQSKAFIAPGLYTSLVSNKNLDDELVYDLVHDIIKAQPELIKHNSNFFGMSEKFDTRYLNYQIHSGALDYYERNKPSFFERYAELGGVMFSMFVVFMTFMVTLNRIVKQRKKDRIDVYYLEVLEIRKNNNYEQAKEQLLALETKALEQLVDEKLAADSSFVVFMQQLSQARLEINEKINPV